MKTELEKCLSGEVFNGSDNELVAMTLNAKRLLKELNNADYADVALKKSILQKLFGKIGENVHIDIDFHCEYGKHILIGNKVVINMNCTFVDNNIIEIGNNVLIASNVQIYTATHSTKVHERMVDEQEKGTEICKTYALPIKICDGAWIGGGAIILPGVTIGENSVIGAGSVVTHSIPDNCVAVGNPCRVIKQIDNED
ncbi:sugar O-acetyltransferase [uncultured Parabacteroides sp.]|uniref:sugar O-acetyltransferase n=1 Tax=uncultured Parabacteroides sp. TaxID=512312 RepID=UPI0028057D5A|nr:sugar O-acetyltransferase [uncultured Parabacteroides sp.]